MALSANLKKHEIMRIAEGDKIELVEPRTPRRKKGDLGTVKSIKYLGKGRSTSSEEYDYECFVIFEKGGTGYYYIADLKKAL